MMRQFLISVALLLILIACNNKKHKVPGEKGGDGEDGEQKEYTINTSINPNNACNNLFLDSSTLSDFFTNDSVSDDIADQMRAFYYARNFEFAWFAPDGITEQGREFWNLNSYEVSSLKDSSFFLKALNKRMPDITTADSMSITPGDKSIIKTELMLSEAFMKFMTKDGKQTSTDDLMKYVPAKKEDIMQSANEVLSDQDGTQNEDAKKAFGLLKEQLKKYYDIAKKGGWQSIAYAHKKLKKGSSSALLPLIKKRLQITGELWQTDTTIVFNDMLDSAVKSFQAGLGYTTDGIITDSLIKDMNIPVQNRIAQLLVNINRARWMPEYTSGRLIVANIPEYALHVYENKQKAFDMNVVVGKEGSGTVIFTGNLTEIVFSPYWNIPPSIVRKEIKPKMDEDPGYLQKEGMEVTGESNGLPIVRQLPGPKNSLGRVKFLFHNSYNIYFHDTPAKNLFNKDKRAYSHGCIRLADPVKMANYLLQDNQLWTPGKIDSAMNNTKEKYVSLKNAVPVIITYYTAWVDETGRLNLRDDIYNHDAAAAAKMFTGQ